MKNLPLLAIALFAVALVGCGKSEVVDVPQEGRVERKEYKDMSVEEKIKFIENTPMPQEAKDKQIAAIKAGTDK